MSDHHLAEAAARALRVAQENELAGQVPRRVTSIERQQAIELIEAAMARRAPHRWRVPVLIAAASALAAAAWLLIPHARAPVAVAPVGPAPAVARVEGQARAVKGQVFLIEPRGESAVGSATPVRPGDRLVTRADGQAELVWKAGSGRVRADVGAVSDVSLLDLGGMQRLLLLTGQLYIQAPHLGADERLIVSTVDTEVEVRGTSFRVQILAAGTGCTHARTRVTVESGRVDVRYGGASTLIAEGGEFLPACAESVATQSPSRRAKPLRRAPPVRPRSLAVNAEPVAAAISPSDLAAQNDLWARALAARGAGEPARAASLLNELQVRYPDGMLTEAAAAELMRLGDPGSARARAAAGAYLRRYPRGFARSEAERIAGSMKE